MKASAARPTKKRLTNYNNIIVSGNNNKLGNVHFGDFYATKAGSGSKDSAPQRKRAHESDNEDERKDEDNEGENYESEEKELGKAIGKEKEVEKEEEKEAHKDEQGEKYTSVWRDWIGFLGNEYNKKKFHPYSPENHNIIRCGRRVSPRPTLDPEIYQKHLKIHVDVEYPIPVECIGYINTVIDSETIEEYKRMARKVPEAEGEEGSAFEFLEDLFRASHEFYTTSKDLEEDENVFNDLLLYPFLKAVGKAVARDVDGCNAEFKTGETYLQAMTNQLKSMELYKDDKSQYKADGLVKLYGLEKLEIVLLETSSHFGNTDQSKISYDHHKGLFGSLAMLKTVADEFSLASMDIFKKIKVFFVHGAGREVLLWSLRFEPEGPAYELWLERSFEINPSFHKRADALPKFINFYWAMVGLVKESAQDIKCLKEDHYTTMRSVRFVQNISLPSLSAAVNPSILRLTEEEDKQGMAQLGPFYFIPLPQSP